MEKPACPKCQVTASVVKAGFNRGGSQRLRCQRCRIYFTPHPKPQGYDDGLKEQAIRLYLEGNSFRGIGKVLRVNHVSVINWVNAHEKTLPAQVEDKAPTDTTETDELFTFIGKKTSTST